MIICWTDILVCCIIICMLDENDRIVKNDYAVLESSDDSSDSQKEMLDELSEDEISSEENAVE